MNYCLLPKNLTPNASSCAILISCDTPLQSVRWCAVEDYPAGLMTTPNNIITVSQNGVYTIELETAAETIVTQFSICHLKPCEIFAGGNGSAASPYLIENCAQFNRIRRNLSAHYRLIADLHFEKEMQNICWLPIGKFSMKDPEVDSHIPLEEQDLRYQISYGFTGELDGDGHTISGLVCNHLKQMDSCIFGSCGNAHIHHLKIMDCLFGSLDCATTLVARSEKSLIEKCSATNISIYSPLSGGLVYAAYPGTIIKECQFEGVLHGLEPYVSLISGVVGDVCERIKSKDPILIEDCCVKAKIFDGDFIGGIVRGNAIVSRCFFCGEIHSSESAGGIQTDGEHCIMNNCVCAATEISCKKEVSIAQPWDREQMAFDDWGVLLGTGVIDHGWMNIAGRIQTDDFTLEPQEEFMNYCTSSCKLCTGTGEYPAIEGSLRDGVTISDEQAHDPDFYRSIGWDFDTVWEMGEDGYPQIISP